MRRSDASGECNVALSVLWQAVKDARHPPCQRERIRAIVFLASKRATLWFDMVGLEQLPALEMMGWTKHAQALLREEAELTKPQRLLLQQVIEVMLNG